MRTQNYLIHSIGSFLIQSALGETLPVLVFSTFSGMIHVYYNLWDYGERQVGRLETKGCPPCIAAATVAQVLYDDEDDEVC